VNTRPGSCTHGPVKVSANTWLTFHDRPDRSAVPSAETFNRGMCSRLGFTLVLFTLKVPLTNDDADLNNPIIRYAAGTFTISDVASPRLHEKFRLTQANASLVMHITIQHQLAPLIGPSESDMQTYRRQIRLTD
jgi:hypothetical protein